MKKALLITILLSGFSALSLGVNNMPNSSSTPFSREKVKKEKPTSGAIESRTSTSTMAEKVEDQKMTGQDMELIRNIRSQIVSDETLSTRAKNITITSKNGRVVLKGAVANSTEKSKVEEIAKKAMGTKSVENLTEVGTF